MNKLIFPSGGMFYDAEDVEFQDSAYREAIHSIVKEVADLGSGTVIMYGCVVTPESTPTINQRISVGAGYVYFNGELCYFGGVNNIATKNIDGSSNRYFWEASNYFDSAGTELQPSLTTADTYQVRRVVLTKFVAQSGITAYFDVVPRYINVLKSYVTTINASSVNIISLSNGWTAPSTNRAVAYLKGTQVTIEGQLTAGQATTNTYTQLCTISLGYRPIILVYRPCMVVDKGMVLLKIDTDGKVYIIDPQAILANGGSIDFGGIKYDAA